MVMTTRKAQTVILLDLGYLGELFDPEYPEVTTGLCIDLLTTALFRTVWPLPRELSADDEVMSVLERQGLLPAHEYLLHLAVAYYQNSSDYIERIINTFGGRPVLTDLPLTRQVVLVV